MYEYQTTFMQDFAAIEDLGEVEINELAEKLFQLWKDDIVHLTELIMVIRFVAVMLNFQIKLIF